MTLIQFDQKNENEQRRVIKSRGVFVGSRMKGENKILLYQVDAFYIELFYDRFEQIQVPIRLLRSFEGVESLDPYLKKIDIKMLLA